MARQSSSVTRHVIDWDMVQSILAGLSGQMTDEQIDAYAQELLHPQLMADLEESQQRYDAARLGKQQEIEDIVSSLAKSIENTRNAYQKSRAD